MAPFICIDMMHIVYAKRKEKEVEETSRHVWRKERQIFIGKVINVQ